jgi:hypothetical protein
MRVFRVGCLQLLTPDALDDISGVATKCLAFTVYSKVQHTPEQDQQQLDAGQLPDSYTAASALPFCCQPLLVLAQAATTNSDQPSPALHQQQAVIAGQPGGAEAPGPEGTQGQGSLPPRTLHCFYCPPPSNSSLLSLAFTDSCGELLHAELLDTAAAGQDSGGAIICRAGALESASLSGFTRMCSSVLRRCLELLTALRAATSPPDLLHRLVIAGGRMVADERRAWRRALEGSPGMRVELPGGVEGIAVVEVEAPVPQRWVGWLERSLVAHIMLMAVLLRLPCCCLT